MSVAVFSPNELSLTITDSAKAFFNQKLAKAQGGSIRLSVKKSGCTGYAYVIDAVDSGSEGDVHISISDISIFVAQQAVDMINGSEIDFVTQGLNKSIQFNNPNVTNSCGCGSSFSVD